jgi:rRNA-processing protein FCF1
MTIAITDANIFIDLIYVELLDNLFGIEMDIHTTLNVIDELKDSQQELLSPYTASKQLTVHTSDDFELPKAIQNNRRLSPSDKSVFGVAVALDAMILTGDGLIRKTATKKIETHGTLWLLDRFLEKGLITKGRAAQQLKHLQGYNKRLPPGECDHRISNWL